MARIAFAWEIGAAYGHATACAALASALAPRGHEPAFIFRELAPLASLRECAGIPAYQAPVARVDGAAEAPPASFADILLAVGYRDASVLQALLQGWLELFERCRPDLVVADSAPTALLAARMLGLKRVAFGNGFAIPPRLTPLPAFRPDAAADSTRAAASEALALANVNHAVAALGGAPLRSLAQQLETDEDFLCTLPELDHYGSRSRAGYWGPRFSIDTGGEARWPYGEGKRVLVYVRAVVPQLDGLIDALVANRCRVVAFIPGLDAARRTRLQSAQRHVSDGPMRLRPLLADCDLVVSEGGTLSVGALMCGVPQLVVPTQLEQSITALRLERIGSALWAAPDAAPGALAAALRSLLAEPRFRAAARGFAARYPAFSPGEQMRRIVLRIEQILGSAVLSPTTNPGGPP